MGLGRQSPFRVAARQTGHFADKVLDSANLNSGAVAVGLHLLYTTNMRTTRELEAEIQSGFDRVVGALREAAGDDLQAEAMTGLLEVAFSGRNRLEAALTTAVGALDKTVQQLPYGVLPDCGLSCTEWLSHTQHISEQAAYAQV